MPAWGPISRRDLIRTLRTLGFEGPFSGGRHGLLSRVLRQAGVTRKEWEKI